MMKHRKNVFDDVMQKMVERVPTWKEDEEGGIQLATNSVITELQHIGESKAAAIALVLSLRTALDSMKLRALKKQLRNEVRKQHLSAKVMSGQSLSGSSTTPRTPKGRHSAGRKSRAPANISTRGGSVMVHATTLAR